MGLASDAMKGLNKAEDTINKEKPAKSVPKSAEKPAKNASTSPQKPATAPNAKNLTGEQAQTLQEMAALKGFIEQNKLGFTQNNGKKYVKVEVWQFLAQQKRLIPTFLVEEGETPDRKYCVKATCILRRDIEGVGLVEVSRSTMTACEDEEFLKDKDRFAVMGLSETRAFARAVKNIYGYLLTVLGFQSTPLEEITEKTKD